MQEFDRQHLWHPYASVGDRAPLALPVKSARGVRLKLEDGRELVDGMSSWWAAIHGYNHPAINRAARRQLRKMSHVMFGGLTHGPAVELGKILLSIVPPKLSRIFYCDSGSVAVEIAIKMAFQYWQGKGERRGKLLALRGAYHGDTFGAMSVCDPEQGMHRHFSSILSKHLFLPRPTATFHEPCAQEDAMALNELLETHHRDIAAIIIEPILQGAGGMWSYSPEYLDMIARAARHYRVPIIADEIATGFGRTGRLFACEHANLVPDILCLGKALSGGYISMAAVLCSEQIATSVDQSEPGALQHGPTFMANPLACAIAHASIKLLLASNWQGQVSNIERVLREELSPMHDHPAVADVRCLGATGVLELKETPDSARLQATVVREGVWLRPFAKLLYTMPPYLIKERDLRKIGRAMRAAITQL